jgi:NMD protein affecting ribosome stability and mRNA decay
MQTIDSKSGYYEAILQLRDCSPKIVEFLNSEIKKMSLVIAKAKKVTNGTDYYLSDGNRAKILGRKLQQRFGGEYKVSASLFSRQDGRNIYRMTILFREIPFQKGELVQFTGEEYKITLIHPEIVLQHSKTGKKIRMKHKDMHGLKKV